MLHQLEKTIVEVVEIDLHFMINEKIVLDHKCFSAISLSIKDVNAIKRSALLEHHFASL